MISPSKEGGKGMKDTGQGNPCLLTIFSSTLWAVARGVGG